jgi:hypothetical protein
MENLNPRLQNELINGELWSCRVLLILNLPGITSSRVMDKEERKELIKMILTKAKREFHEGK